MGSGTCLLQQYAYLELGLLIPNSLVFLLTSLLAYCSFSAKLAYSCLVYTSC